MIPLTSLESKAVPLLRDNIDTDAIIPSREMRSVSKDGLADGLFAGWRYTAIGGREINPDFVLNRPESKGARILLGGANFGCGSSREHAVWALAEYGFRVVIAPSFSPIFQGNCIRNGIAPIVLPREAVEQIAAGFADGTKAQVDLLASEVRMGPAVFPFTMEDEARTMLIEGADAIELTLRHRSEIDAFFVRDAADRPWIYLSD
ncbi:3-isopropylmalate dehydratase small subunit [Novosphingobium gossypii]|uniref:3-isopropylmalate dehydratase small subunit n=1 Tax=Novosphingobium gossypii TaxID=1604774 RepID=UPI003D233713